MVFYNFDDKIKCVTANCNCGCSTGIAIKKMKDDDCYYISFYSDKFYEEQTGIFKIIARRLKRAWYSLRGKDYRYFELILNEYEMKRFYEHIKYIRSK